MSDETPPGTFDLAAILLPPDPEQEAALRAHFTEILKQGGKAYRMGEPCMSNPYENPHERICFAAGWLGAWGAAEYPPHRVSLADRAQIEADMEAAEKSL